VNWQIRCIIASHYRLLWTLPRRPRLRNFSALGALETNPLSSRSSSLLTLSYARLHEGNYPTALVNEANLRLVNASQVVSDDDLLEAVCTENENSAFISSPEALER
jgi:hypothetical protein